MNTKHKHIIIALVISLAYTLISAKYIQDEKFIVLAIPAILLAGLFIFLRMDLALLVVYFLIPLSVPLREYFPALEVDMYLFSEPILVFLTLLFLLKIFISKEISRSLFTHPVSISIYFSLIWIFITSATSSIPLVSFKFLASRLWFIIPFYFIAAHLFEEKKNIRRFLILYALGLIIVIFYTINNHLGYGLNDQEASNWVCSPFYNDHTAYGAALAMILFASIPLLLSKRDPIIFRRMIWFILPIIVFALVFSYSRAAWLSVVGAIGVLILTWFRIKLKWVLLVIFIMAGSASLFYNEIVDTLERNEQDSSDNFSQHISSMTNISTDASNVERLNRWNSAIRMFKEKPILGWGPGTYTFQYAPFQFSRDRTIISTNFGDGGNAHSEYLGPLAESGILGPVYFLLIGIFSLITGFRVYHQSEDRDSKLLSLFITLGLITYLLHAFLNNFLDTDKLSALFWGFIAILVSMDIKLINQKREAGQREREV